MKTQSDFDAALAVEISKYYADPLGFVKFIYPWGEKGTTLESYDGPDTWQVDLLTELGSEIRARNFNGVDAVEPVRFSIASGHGIGKSALTSWLMHFILSTRPNARGVVTSGSYDQLQGKTFAEAAKWLKLSLNRHWWEYRGTKGNLAIFRSGSQENWNVRGQASTAENADAFAGLHNANSTPFFIFDEASAVPNKIYEVAEGGLTDGEPMIFLFGNPTKSTGAFADSFGKNRHRWLNKQIDSRASSMTNKVLLKQWEDDWGEDSDFFRVRVKGQFPRVGDSQFISSELVEAAQLREIDPTPVEPIVMGVDVARFGDDSSIILVRHGRKILAIKKYRELDLMSLAAMVIEAIAEYKPHAVFVDGAGVGGGVIDRLKQLAFHPLEVQAGSKASAPEQFINLRAEMWWRMRDWLATADIPKNELELKTDLTGIQYGYTDKMQIRMERKKDMKSRGLASPDIGDALSLTFAETVNPIARPRTKRSRNINWRTL